MKISEMIAILSSVIAEHGDIPIVHYHDSVEYNPRIEISDTRLVQDEDTLEYKQIDVPKRCMIK